jgi:hypothetical protein
MLAPLTLHHLIDGGRVVGRGVLDGSGALSL